MRLMINRQGMTPMESIRHAEILTKLDSNQDTIWRLTDQVIAGQSDMFYGQKLAELAHDRDLLYIELRHIERLAGQRLARRDMDERLEHHRRRPDIEARDDRREWKARLVDEINGR